MSVNRLPFAVLTAVILMMQSLAADDAQMSAFDLRIAPLLVQRCFACHNAATKKGGLDLSSRKGAMAGGESGVVIAAGKPDKSLLWERVSGEEMPPKHPLSADEKQMLHQWIAEGAKWGTDPVDPFRFTTDKRAGYDWWSLQPLARFGAGCEKRQMASQ